MSHTAHLVPHPVIRPGGIDYRPPCRFEMEMDPPTAAGDHIRVRLSLDLKSRTLEGLVTDQKAVFCLVAGCAYTNHREALRTSERTVVWNLPRSDYARNLRITPYLVATGDIHLPCSDEHDEELRPLIPDGVDLLQGSILAVGSPYDITLFKIPTIQSAVAMVSKSKAARNRYWIGTDKDFIEIILHPETHKDMLRIRERAAELLYPSLYMAAIEQAMRDMGEHSDRRWALALQKTLQEHGIDHTAPDFADNAADHAQTILKNPLERLVRWHRDGGHHE